MFKTAYDTTAASPFLSKDILSALSIARAEGLLIPANPDQPSLLVLLDTGVRAKDIPKFDHPVKLESNNGKDVWVIDMRPYASRVTVNEGSVETVKDSPAALLVLRGQSEIYWNKFNPRELMFWGDLPLVVFAKWITGALKNRLGLNAQDLLQTQAIAAYYYANLFYKEEEFTPKVKEFITLKINRHLRIPLEIIKSALSSVDYLSRLSDLSLALSNVVDNPSMRMVDDKYLINALINSWFATTDSRSLVAVSLEFPPAFVSMVLSCGRTSMYKKSIIGTIVEGERAKYRFDDFHHHAMMALKSIE